MWLPPLPAPPARNESNLRGSLEMSVKKSCVELGAEKIFLLYSLFLYCHEKRGMSLAQNGIHHVPPATTAFRTEKVPREQHVYLL